MLTTLPPSCAVVMKSGNVNTSNAELNPIFHLLALLGAHLILHVSWIRVNFLEPSGPLQACNGTALPFLLKFKIYLSNLYVFYKLTCGLRYEIYLYKTGSL